MNKKLLTQVSIKPNIFQITFEFLDQFYMGTLLRCVLVTHQKLEILEMIWVLFTF
jgi:hypothetical protein